MRRLPYTFPEPKWTEIIILWNTILAIPINPKEFYRWCYKHKSNGKFHVHGYQSSEGFAFRFEYPSDALLFTLRWSNYILT